MITATFTQLRNNAAGYFNRVEKGETVRIYRNGKPSAVLVKAEAGPEPKTRWKNAKPVLDLGSDIASRMFREERKKAR